jgi:hypothetical protein
MRAKATTTPKATKATSHEGCGYDDRDGPASPLSELYSAGPGMSEASRQRFIERRSAARAALRLALLCGRCQRPLEAARSTKRYCSDRCRVAASRPAHQKRVRIREARLDPRPTMTTLEGSIVERVTYAEAKALILRYEWLGTMPALTTACYGLRTSSGELAGVVVFGPGPGTASVDLCGPQWRGKAIALLRGACVHWAHPHAASHLIARVCRLAAKDFGWRVFYAHADAAAGEVGVVYQACNWLYLGVGNGRGHKVGHWRFYDRRRQTWLSDRSLRQRGFREADACRDLRFRAQLIGDKGRFVWFAGDRRERRKAREALRYPVLPYPKRALTRLSDASSHPGLTSQTPAKPGLCASRRRGLPRQASSGCTAGCTVGGETKRPAG